MSRTAEAMSRIALSASHARASAQQAAVPPSLVLQRDATIGVNTGVAGGAAHALDSDSFVCMAGASAVVGSLSTGEQAAAAFRGHTGVIGASRLSRSGALLATAQRGQAADVIVWSMGGGAAAAGRGTQLHRFYEHDHAVTSLDFSDDDRLLVSTGCDGEGGTLVIWDLATGGIVAWTKLAEPFPVLCVRFGGMVLDLKGRPTSLYQLAVAGKGGAALYALEPTKGVLAKDAILVAPSQSRDYTVVEFSTAVNRMACAWLYLGATTGEVTALQVSSKAVQGVISITSGAITALTVNPNVDGAFTLAAGTSDGGVAVVRHAGHGAASCNAEGLASSSLPRPLVLQRFLRIAGGAIWGLDGVPGSWGQATAFTHSSSGPHNTEAYAHKWLLTNASGALMLLETTPAPVSTIASIDSRAVHHGSTPPGGPSQPLPPAGLTARLVLQGAAGCRAGEKDPFFSPAFKESSRFASDCAAARSSLAVASFHVSSIPHPLITASNCASVDAVAAPPGDPDHFATCGTDCCIRVWDLSSGSPAVLSTVAVSGAGRPACLVFPAGAEFTVSGWQDGSIRSYRAHQDAGGSITTTARGGSGGRHGKAGGGGEGEGGSLLWLIPNAHTTSTEAAAAAPNTAHGSSTALANSAGGGALAAVAYGGVTSLVLTGNQRALVSAGGTVIRVWDVRTRELLAHFSEHAAPVTALCLLPGSSGLLSVGRDRSLLTWDLGAMRRMDLQSQPLSALTGVGVTLDGCTAVTAAADGHLGLWDIGHPGGSRAGATGPKGSQTVASSSVGVGPMTAIGPAHAPSAATCIAMAHTMNVFASGGTDGNIQLWDVATALPLCEAQEGHAAATVRGLIFTSDDRQLVSVGSDGCLVVWNVFMG